MDPDKLTGPQKAAIFLMAMGEQFSTQIMRKMQEGEIRKIAAQMSEIEYVPPEVLDRVLQEFIQEVEGSGPMMVNGQSFMKSVVQGAVGLEKAQAVLGDLDGKNKAEPFSYIETMDTKALIRVIKGEHPQTIAMILGHVKPSRAAAILGGLPKEIQGDVAMRIADIDQIPVEIVQQVDMILQKEVTNLGASGAKAVGGLETLATILNEVDRGTEENIFSWLEEEREEMVEQVRQLMFVFEDLLKVDDRGMREILKQVETQDLTVALKTASEEMKAKIFSNLSERAAGMLQEDMEVMGPVRLTDVEQAQQRIIRAARELEAEGRIMLAKGKEDLLV